MLIESGAAVNSDSGNGFGNTPLHAATRVGSIEVIKLLLENGANINALNNRGSTSLHFCAFLSNGIESVNENSEENDEIINGRNTKHDIFLIIANLLIAEGIDINQVDLNGYSALHVASQRGCIDMVQLLVESGASLTCKTKIDDKGRGGRTPLGMAQFGGQDDVFTFLAKVEGDKAKPLTYKGHGNGKCERKDIMHDHPVGSGVAAARSTSFVKR